MTTQRDVIRRNVAEIIKAKGFSNLKKWCETHGFCHMILYKQNNKARKDYGMSCGNLLKLCNELNVTPNDLLKGLY